MANRRLSASRSAAKSFFIACILGVACSSAGGQTLVESAPTSRGTEVALLTARMAYFSAAVADASATLRGTTAERPVTERSAALNKARRVTAEISRALNAPIDTTPGFEALIASRLKSKRLLDELASAAVQSARDALADPDRALRAVAFDTLIEFGARAAPALDAVLEAFDHAVDEERSKALFAISALRPRTENALPRLVRGLTAPDVEVRKEASFAIADLGPLARTAVPALTRALDDASDKVRVNAARALGAIGPDARTAVPRLMTELDRNDWGFLGTIAVALSAIDPNSPATRARLERWVHEGPEEMREAAENALKDDAPDWAYPPMPPIPSDRAAIPFDRLNPKDRRKYPMLEKSGWGPEIEGWWLAVDADASAAYDTDLDHREAVMVLATLFVVDEGADLWNLMEQLRLTVRVTAVGLPDFVRTVERPKTWFNGVSAFRFAGFELRLVLRDLFEHWGRLPADIGVSVQLDQPPLPAVVARELRVALHQYAPFDGCTESRPAGAANVDWRCDLDGRTQLLRDRDLLIAKTEAEQAAVIMRGARSFARIDAENDMVYAARAGQADRVKRALDRCLDVDARLARIVLFSSDANGMTALMMAAWNGREDVATLLVTRGAALELVHQGRTALHYAVDADDERIARLLVAAGAKGDLGQLLAARAVIRAACRDFSQAEGSRFPPWPGRFGKAGGPSMLSVLDDGSDADATDQRGLSALMYAANLGQIEAVRLLLARGAEPMRRSPDGKTARDFAATSWTCAELDPSGTILQLIETAAASRPQAK